MKRCPITYESIGNNELYSLAGLKKLSRRLNKLDPLPFTAEEQRQEAALRSDKMSIQGVQPKLSAILKIKEGRFDIVSIHGKYILKPQCDFPELPQNEGLTMSMAEIAGFDVPIHGLLYSADGSFTYFIKRFDRARKNETLPIEDFAQLTGEKRATKYNGSMEKVAKAVEKYCTFPLLENIELFKRTIFAFLIGDEDMHLKNFSLITSDGITKFSPIYDTVNSTIAMRNPRDELALFLNGKKSNIKKTDLIDHFGTNQLGLNLKTMDEVLSKFSASISQWEDLIKISFLSEQMKKAYLNLLDIRRKRLEL